MSLRMMSRRDIVTQLGLEKDVGDEEVLEALERLEAAQLVEEGVEAESERGKEIVTFFDNARLQFFEREEILVDLLGFSEDVEMPTDEEVRERVDKILRTKLDAENLSLQLMFNRTEGQRERVSALTTYYKNMLVCLQARAATTALEDASDESIVSEILEMPLTSQRADVETKLEEMRKILTTAPWTEFLNVVGARVSGMNLPLKVPDAVRSFALSSANDLVGSTPLFLRPKATTAPTAPVEKPDYEGMSTTLTISVTSEDSYNVAPKKVNGAYSHLVVDVGDVSARGVAKMELANIQIPPVNGIGTFFGSNFFYFLGRETTLEGNDRFAFKVELDGQGQTYADDAALISAIGTSIAALQAANPWISFGTTGITSSNSQSTLTVDIRKVFHPYCYEWQWTGVGLTALGFTEDKVYKLGAVQGEVLTGTDTVSSFSLEDGTRSIVVTISGSGMTTVTRTVTTALVNGSGYNRAQILAAFQAAIAADSVLGASSSLTIVEETAGRRAELDIVPSSISLGKDWAKVEDMTVTVTFTNAALGFSGSYTCGEIRAETKYAVTDFIVPEDVTIFVSLKDNYKADYGIEFTVSVTAGTYATQAAFLSELQSLIRAESGFENTVVTVSNDIAQLFSIEWDANITFDSFTYSVTRLESDGGLFGATPSTTRTFTLTDNVFVMTFPFAGTYRLGTCTFTAEPDDDGQTFALTISNTITDFASHSAVASYIKAAFNAYTDTQGDYSLKDTTVSATLVNNVVTLTITLVAQKIITESAFYVIFNGSEFWTPKLGLTTSTPYFLLEENSSALNRIATTGTSAAAFSPLIVVDSTVIAYLRARSDLQENETNGATPEIEISIPSGSYTFSALVAAINSVINPAPLNAVLSQSDDGYTILNAQPIEIIGTENFDVVFYNNNLFLECNFGKSNLKAVSPNTTLGYLLGFTKYVQYELASRTSTSTNIARLIGETSVTRSLFKHAYLILNDFTDGAFSTDGVSIARPINNTQNQKVIQSTVRQTTTCDPETGEAVTDFELIPKANGQNYTQKEIYAAMAQYLSNPSAASSFFSSAEGGESGDSSRTDFTAANLTLGYYGTSANTKLPSKVFAVIPLNAGAVTTLPAYTGFNPNVRYFSRPISLSKLEIKLLDSNGNFLPLSSDWSINLTLFKQH